MIEASMPRKAPDLVAAASIVIDDHRIGHEPLWVFQVKGDFQQTRIRDVGEGLFNTGSFDSVSCLGKARLSDLVFHPGLNTVTVVEA